MKIIPENKIEEAFVKYNEAFYGSSEFYSLNDPGDVEVAKSEFKAGASFAESKFQEAFKDIIIENQGLKLYKDNEAKRFEELAVEFAEWICSHKEGFHPMYRDKYTTNNYWGSSYTGGRPDYTSKELFNEFLKERNGKI